VLIFVIVGMLLADVFAGGDAALHSLAHPVTHTSCQTTLRAMQLCQLNLR
jgi:hypothetical protein